MPILVAHKKVKHARFTWIKKSEFWKQLASVIVANGGHIEHVTTVFNVTSLHCNERG